MNDRVRSGETMDCASVRDILPLSHLGLLPEGECQEVESHLGTCVECREESHFLVRLQGAKVEPPADLHARILAASAANSQRRHRAGWGLGWGTAAAAAAALVVALGWGSLRGTGGGIEELWTIALEPEATMRWYGNDWVVAGDPHLDALPDELLRELLEEMTP